MRWVGWLGGVSHHRLCLFKIDRDKLADALLAHRYANQAVHPRHSDRMVRDDQEARVGAAGHFIQKVTKARDVGIIKGCANLIQHTDRRRNGEEDCKDKRHRSESWFTA